MAFRYLYYSCMDTNRHLADPRFFCPKLSASTLCLRDNILHSGLKKRTVSKAEQVNMHQEFAPEVNDAMRSVAMERAKGCSSRAEQTLSVGDEAEGAGLCEDGGGDALRPRGQPDGGIKAVEEAAGYGKGCESERAGWESAHPVRGAERKGARRPRWCGGGVTETPVAPSVTPLSFASYSPEPIRDYQVRELAPLDACRERSVEKPGLAGW